MLLFYIYLIVTQYELAFCNKEQGRNVLNKMYFKHSVRVGPQIAMANTPSVASLMMYPQ